MNGEYNICRQYFFMTSLFDEYNIIFCLTDRAMENSYVRSRTFYAI